MGARSRRPKAVFLASDEADLALVQTLLSGKDCRVIPAHSRNNAVKAFELLLKSGYQGIFTAVNTHFAPPTDQDIIAKENEGSKDIVGIEGIWEEVKSQGSMLAGQHVRVTVVDNPDQPANGYDRPSDICVPNAAMLEALSDIEEIRKGMNPKKGTKDYLREARSGAMYGFGDDD
jgi:hypothetical protein